MFYFSPEYSSAYRNWLYKVSSRDINNPQLIKKFPKILLNTNNHSRVCNNIPLFRTLCQINPVHALPTVSLRYVLILYSHLCLGLPSDLFVRFSHPTVACTSPLLLYVPHTLPISLFLIWSIGYYFPFSFNRYKLMKSEKLTKDRLLKFQHITEV